MTGNVKVIEERIQGTQGLDSNRRKRMRTMTQYPVVGSVLRTAGGQAALARGSRRTDAMQNRLGDQPAGALPA